MSVLLMCCFNIPMFVITVLPVFHDSYQIALICYNESIFNLNHTKKLVSRFFSIFLMRIKIFFEYVFK